MDIQLMWVIDEYAIIDRSCVWRRPPSPPNRHPANDIRITGVGSNAPQKRIKRGVSFCQEDRIRHIVQETAFITRGNQK